MYKFNSKSIQSLTALYDRMVKGYPEWTIFLDKADISGSTSINTYKGNILINKYYFYPNRWGSIESIAIYGQQLEGHYKTISNSNMIFGFRVKSIDLITNDTVSPYVDIFIDEALFNPLSELNSIEQMAILQIVYQLVISSDGTINKIKDVGVIDFALSELGYDSKGLNRIQGNLLWNKAIDMNPYEAFNIATKLGDNYKQELKRVLMAVANNGANILNRLNVAKQILKITGIE